MAGLENGDVRLPEWMGMNPASAIGFVVWDTENSDGSTRLLRLVEDQPEKYYRAFRQYGQHTTLYRLYPKGLQDLGPVSAISEDDALHQIVNKWDDQNYFPQEDGSIKDCDTQTIFEPGDGSVDFGDYYYYVQED